MPTHPLAVLALAVSLGLATPSLAQTDNNSTAPEGETAPDPKTLTNPNDKHAVTPEEMAECMKTWDAQTGMSKAEYERSCRSTLKYFPARP